MTYAIQKNVNVVKSSPVRVFDGIGGDRVEVLRRANNQGYDISYTVSNEMEDFDLTRRGVARLRDGSRKINSDGESTPIDAISFLRIGGRLAYFTIFDGTMTVADIPLRLTERQVDGITLTPATTLTAVSSARLAADPSYPV